MSEIVNFLESPLVTWVKTFGEDEPVAFEEFCDGIFFNDVLLQIDQREVDRCERINRNPTDQNSRLQNWNILLKNIKSFYQDVLQQIVVTANPDVFALVDDPTKDNCLEDMEKIMLLLLGCAVQCERKAHYIEKITSLEISTQQVIVQWIRQVTDTPDHVVSPDMISADSDIAKQIYVVLKRVVKQRDEHFENSVILKQERNYFSSEVEKTKGHFVPPPTLEKYHMAKELQKQKNKLTSTTEELEEMRKVVSDLKDELELKGKDLSKARSESMLLSKDANLARIYRDELDTLKEQTMKIDKYEKELTKYKEKIHEMEYFKTRVEELKEDNVLLADAKDNLDVQYSELQKRADSSMQDVLNVQSKMEDMKQERGQQQQKLEEALEANATLEFERTRAKDGYSGPLRKVISYTSAEFLHGSNLQLSGHPISEELNDSMHSHVTKLEMENGQLKNELEEIKTKLHNSQVELENLIHQSEKDYHRRKQEFEKEQTQLKLKITNEVTNELKRSYDSKMKDAQEAARAAKSQIVHDYDAKVKHLEKENREFREQLEERNHLSVKEQTNKLQELTSNYEGQIRQLQLKNNELTTKVDQIPCQTRSKKPIRDEQNKSLSDPFAIQDKLLEQKRQIENELQVKVHHLQREKEDLHFELDSLQEELGIEKDKYEQLVFDYQRLEKERTVLKESVDTVRECSDNHIKSLEQELANIQTKAVAMENLNDYLNNLSATDEHVFLQNDEKYSDENHNTHDISRDSLRSLPADLSKIAWNNVRHKSDMHDSICSEHLYAEIPSFSKGHRLEKINYVKSPNTSKDSNAKQENYKTSGIFGKLKSYVRPQKELDIESKSRKSKEHSNKTQRTSLQEVKMRERPAFDRNSKHRHTVQNIQMKESGPNFKSINLKSPITQSHSKPVSQTFSRDHALRKTMPERRTTYRFPEKTYTHSRDSSQQSLLSQDGYRTKGLHSSESHHSHRHHSGQIDTNSREISVDEDDFRVPSNPYHAHCDRKHCYTDADIDSGCPQSSENSPPNKLCDITDKSNTSQTLDKHRLTSIEILSTETIKKRFMSGSTSNNSLVQQIVKLQDHNIGLSAENEQLRKSMDTLKCADTSDDSVLQKLEAENRKLKMIIETLQYTLSGRNPYDNTEYHYFTNV